MIIKASTLVWGCIPGGCKAGIKDSPPQHNPTHCNGLRNNFSIGSGHKPTIPQANSFANPVAIGETGLDATIDCPISLQTLYFESQLQAACEFDLPIIIHVRKSHNSGAAIAETIPAK